MNMTIFYCVILAALVLTQATTTEQESIKDDNMMMGDASMKEEPSGMNTQPVEMNYPDDMNDPDEEEHINDDDDDGDMQIIDKQHQMSKIMDINGPEFSCSSQKNVKTIQSLQSCLRSCTNAAAKSLGCNGGFLNPSPPFSNPNPRPSPNPNPPPSSNPMPGSRFTSCAAVAANYPNSKSGYYNIKVNGKTIRVYCRMCSAGGYQGPWIRLAYMDMKKEHTTCPLGFKEFLNAGIKTCGRQTSSSGSCQSVKFYTQGIKYTQISGRILGYQVGSPSGTSSFNQNINSYYVDGVSLTRGSPRKHVWTFMAGFLQDFIIQPVWNCPCSKGSTMRVPSFIGNDYFCESGSTKSSVNIFYSQDPLWDMKKCLGLEPNCCIKHAGSPWFNHKIIGSPTSDYIELRVCCDEASSNEDVRISKYEIYIK